MKRAISSLFFLETQHGGLSKVSSTGWIATAGVEVIIRLLRQRKLYGITIQSMKFHTLGHLSVKGIGTSAPSLGRHSRVVWGTTPNRRMLTGPNNPKAAFGTVRTRLFVAYEDRRLTSSGSSPRLRRGANSGQESGWRSPRKGSPGSRSSPLWWGPASRGRSGGPACC